MRSLHEALTRMFRGPRPLGHQNRVWEPMGHRSDVIDFSRSDKIYEPFEAGFRHADAEDRLFLLESLNAKLPFGSF